jgi:acetyl esterase
VLAADAAGYLERAGGAIRFPAEQLQSREAIDAFLERDRTRLRLRPGADAIGSEAQAIPVTDVELPGGVAVRVYRPAGGEARKPAVVYLHGGGWVSGSTDQHDSTCRLLALRGDVVVVNVGYRLSPEHPYPAPLDDCEAALRWTITEGERLHGVDPERVAVAGSSSGGNLAAALALRASSSIRLQVLIYPALDARMSGASHLPSVNGAGYNVSTEQMRWYWEMYRGDSGADVDDPDLSPFASSHLASAPPAIIVTAEFDLLRDDGLGYAEKLAAAGVPVVQLHFPGQIHGFMGLFDDLEEARDAAGALGALVGQSLRAGLPDAAGVGGRQ